MTKKNSIKFLTIAIFCLLLGIGQVFAQSTVTGGIRGTVTDPQRANVPNATITATNVGTNQNETVTSDENGTFVINNLQPGTYNVVVNQTGFGDFTAQRVVVEVGQTTTLDATLAVAGQTATVEVTAEAPVINTNDNSNATNINQTSINELPINGRRASNFVLLTPATVPDGTFGLISFRGISGLLNNSTVDGGDNNQAFFSEERGRTRINYVISQSAVREFQVNTSNYSAEYGRSAGGVINTVTKSGTNQFSGELFYYNRNNRNGARNPLARRTVLVNGVSTVVAAKPVDLREQFGGAIGGPILKDRLFFFFSYDQQKRNFPGLATFSNANFLNTVNRTLLTSRGLSSTRIDSTLGFLNSLTGETPRSGDQTLILPKIDWQINDSNLFSVSYNRLRWESPNGIQTQAVNNRGRSSFGDDFVEVDSLNARVQSTLSPTLLNEFRFQYGRDFESQFSTAPLPGEPTTATTIGGTRAPNIFITGGLEFGTPTFLERPAFPDERRVQFADTVTYSRGRHTFKFGGDVNRVTDDIQNLRFEAGAYSYNNINDFIIDYANSQTPLPSTTQCATQPAAPAPANRFVGRCYTSNFSQGIGSPGLNLLTYDYNFFIQDDFRATSRLTVNLGMRYEYIKVPEATLVNTSTATIPNDGRTLAEATSTLPNDKNNFGPRIGFAYDIFGDSKTVIRGGYGIYYGRIQNSTIYNALVNTGNSGGQAQLSIPTTDPLAPIFPNVLPTNNLTFRAGAIQFFQRDFQAPLINQFDLILERELFENTVVSVSYIRSLGRNLPTFVDQNLVACADRTALSATCQSNATTTTFNIVGGPNGGQSFTFPLFTRANSAFQQLTQIQSTVESEYDALVLQANRRFSKGLQFQASYTFAKSTDTNQNSATFTQNNSPLDPFDRSFDRGPSNFDVRHKFVVSAVYAPNFYKGDSNSIYNYLLNGFSISPIYTFYSGRPYDGGVSGTSLNNTNGDNRFPLNDRNSFRLPSLHNLDLRLSKRFRFSERYNLELLAEGFNIINRTQVFGVNSTLYTRGATAPVGGVLTSTLTFNPTFGDITGTDSTLYRERQIQLAARFQF
ncbi:MAG: carboxypeptidase regulatory-like domain-containing protein [Acidobacteriota bacterium]|nr:carboxypeptidase regulatory-like domain-containing protein [Acidobacteriota bacterium]